MVSQNVVIKNPTGLHLRPAGILCKEAMVFKSLITFTFKGCWCSSVQPLLCIQRFHCCNMFRADRKAME